MASPSGVRLIRINVVLLTKGIAAPGSFFSSTSQAKPSSLEPPRAKSVEDSVGCEWWQCNARRLWSGA